MSVAEHFCLIGYPAFSHAGPSFLEVFLQQVPKLEGAIVEYGGGAGRRGSLRPFRFGEQYEREATQYGLWLEAPGTMEWRVISMDRGVIDEDDDPYVEPDRIVGASFFEWFKEWMESD